MEDRLNQILLLVDFQYLKVVFLFCTTSRKVGNNLFLDEPPNYRLATGIVLTFLVNNNVDKAELEPAMEWEKK